MLVQLCHQVVLGLGRLLFKELVIKLRLFARLGGRSSFPYEKNKYNVSLEETYK